MIFEIVRFRCVRLFGSDSDAEEVYADTQISRKGAKIRRKDAKKMQSSRRKALLWGHSSLAFVLSLRLCVKNSALANRRVALLGFVDARVVGMEIDQSSADDRRHRCAVHRRP
jgi:hypothetical protein